MSEKDPGMGVMVIDTEAQRMMRERFGCEKPIPAATMRRTARIQEAARLYIHNFWDVSRCASFAGCAVGNLHKVKEQDGWDEFVGLISQEMKPSIWVASDIEIPDLDLIQREKKRRVDDIEILKAEEMKVTEALSVLSPVNKSYQPLLNSLTRIRRLIDDATGASYYHAEQSAGRRAMMAKAIKGVNTPAEENGLKKAEGKTYDI